MSVGLRIAAIVLVVLGLVWLGQGLGYIHGSFMTGQTLWAVIGAVCLVAGAALGYRVFLRPRPPGA